MFSLHENLYHYTRAKTLIDKILPSKEIQFGSYQNLNDPREAKTWPFIFYTSNVETNDKFKSSVFEEVSNYITQKTLILCCTQDDPSVTDEDKDRDIRSGYGHPRMWSQYADEHKGVCIVFNKKSLHKSILKKFGSKGLYFGPVKYLKTVTGPNSDAYHIQYLDDILKNGTPNVIEPHIDKYNKELFFTKHIDWQDEWEYRWIFRSKDDTPILISIADCIKAVIVGNECTAKDTGKIVSICATLGIPVTKLLQHGWSMSLMPIDTDEKNVISLNGVSFSTKIPCTGVFTQAHDNTGKIRPILIKNNGDVIVVE